MHIIVGSTAYEIDGAATSVDSLKSMIENREFIPAHMIRLVHDGQVLEDLEGLEEDAQVSMTYEMNAGMRAKWRKKRMRRLRRKRRKMRQRAK